MAFISEVQKALKQDTPFTVLQNSEGQWRVGKLSFWSRIFHWRDRDFHQMRIDTIARAIFDTLKQVPILPINESLKRPEVDIAKKFLRQFDFSKMQSFDIKRCSRQLLATKLGLTLENFDQNPDFDKFAFKSHLERYLLMYGHELRRDQTTGEISLLCEGTYLPWKQINTKFSKWKEHKKKNEYPGQPWLYGNAGVQELDMYAWKKLDPHKIVPNHNWGNKYYFDFCACCSESVQLNGDHSWLELRAPGANGDGEIYSAGLYRQGKNSRLDNYKFPMRVKKGYLMSPDVSIWWPTPIYRIPVEITKDQFLAIKESIEQDKENEVTRSFQLFNGNCQQYVNSKAQIAGIKLPTERNVIKDITPTFLKKGAKMILPKLPQLVQRVCLFVAAFFLNLLQLVLGATVVDKAMKNAGACVKTHLSSFRDLFDPDKLIYHPPRQIAKLKKKIDQGRFVFMHPS